MNFVLHFLVLCIKDAVEATRMDFSYRNMYVRATYRDMDGICGND